MKAIEPRLDRITRRMGWQLTTLRDDRGHEVTVRTLPPIDEWLRLALHGGAVALSPRLVAVLSRVRVRSSDGAWLVGLRDACREALTKGER